MRVVSDNLETTTRSWATWCCGGSSEMFLLRILLDVEIVAIDLPQPEV